MKGKKNAHFQIEKYKGINAVGKHKFHVIKSFKIIKKLNEKKRINKSLDVGCADGGFSEELKKVMGIDCYGVDISPNSVKLAREKGIKAKVHDVQKKFPYKDNTFDLVFAFELIEHVFDTDFFLHEMNRISKKGGILILTTPNLCSMTNRLRILFGRYPAHGPQFNAEKGHHIVYTLPTLKKHLRKYGFVTIKSVASSIPFPMANDYVPYFLKKVSMWLGDFFPSFGSHLIVVAEKRT